MNSERCYNDPSESLKGLSADLEGSTLLDFWKWAFCDLCDDDIKGIFAEWVVAKLLNHNTRRRISWANSDLITESGIRVEVKASAFHQSWKLLDEHGKLREQVKPIKKRDDIRFSGLQAKDAGGDHPEAVKQYKSDIYVFAFQHEESSSKWNAMDLNQWEFYIVERARLQASSISLKNLDKLGKRLTADGLGSALAQAIAKQEAGQKAAT